MPKKFLVVGSSAAGIGAVNKLRALDSQAEITLVTASTVEPYNTCLLADMLSGKRSEQQVRTKPFSFFQEKRIEYLGGIRVVRIHLNSKTITLSDDRTLSYNKLFLGLGMTARRLPLPGFDSAKNLFSFQTMEDTHAIAQYLKKNKVKQAVVIGAGLSGVECADSLSSNGVSVTLIESSTKVLQHQVDERGSDHLIRALENAGTRVMTNVTVSCAQKKADTIYEVTLADGSTIPADMVVVTIGGKVNSQLLSDAGAELVGNHVKIDEYMKTSLLDVYAGGDMCVVRDMIMKRLVPNTAWPDAMMQGMVAASNMVGVEKKYPGIQPTASSHFAGITYVSCGPVVDPRYEKSVIKDEQGAYHVLIMDNDRLIGFLMVGKVNNVGLLRKHVLLKTPIDQVIQII